MPVDFFPRKICFSAIFDFHFRENPHFRNEFQALGKRNVTDNSDDKNTNLKDETEDEEQHAPEGCEKSRQDTQTITP